MQSSEFSDWAGAAILAYNRELSGGEVGQVEDYLADLYGFTLHRTRESCFLALGATRSSAGVPQVPSQFHRPQIHLLMR